VLKNFFKKTPPLKDALDETILKLSNQKRKLEMLNLKLQSRNSMLFDSCAKAFEKKDAERANIYANELSELKKVQKTVNNGLLLLEQLVLRLETLREIGSTFAQLQPTLEVVKNISTQLSEVMPAVSNELSQIGNTLNDAMFAMKIEMNDEVMMRIPESCMNDEIIEEASRCIYDKLEAELPEPPKEIAMRRAIALGGDDGEDEIFFKLEPAPRIVMDRTKNENGNETALMAYLNKKRGNFDFGECMAHCGMSEKELVKVIEGLSRKGLLRMQTIEGAIANDGSK